ncbi:hypothetical protein AB0L30_14515 [Microbispora rosea]|uniref:hypothetical protein n=1 Tax=Microbispora rosea TaxID=58117 RepID=UPI003427D572
MPRDEGEASARTDCGRGAIAGVRHNGTPHGFIMLDPVRSTAAAGAAVTPAIEVIEAVPTSGKANS